MKSLQRLRVVSVAAASLLVLLTTACGSQTPEKEFEDFDRNNFDHSTNIDNEWFPLKPGTRFVWEGTSVDDEGDEEAHTVVFTVTDLTKVIDGVRTVVCWDQDYVDGELEETEIVFFAQDNDGVVWHFGEYPEEYDEGKLVAAPGWIHGIGDGRAGIMMKANPKVGTPSYSQGWAPSVNWTDRAEVYKVGQKTTVPAGSYEDVLVMSESSQEEPDAQQLKYYARGVGLVRVGFLGDQPDQEILELIRVGQLSREGLAKARNEALKLEKHAYKISKDVYAHTAPAIAPDGSSVVPDRSPDTEDNAQKVRAKKITEEQAKKIALKTVPGDVTAVAIEKKLGANRYVVEVLAKEDGVETDVIIDMETGKVLATEE